jgi:hypothetical protein
MDRIIADVAIGDPVDVTEEVRDALACCPHKLTSLVEDLIAVAEMQYVGRRVPQDYTERDDWPALAWITSRVIQRYHTKYRAAQMLGPDMVKLRPFAEFSSGPRFCEASRNLDGQFVPRDSIVPLPFPTCDFAGCYCSFRTRSRFEVEKMAEKAGQAVEDYVAQRMTKYPDR